MPGLLLGELLVASVPPFGGRLQGPDAGAAEQRSKDISQRGSGERDPEGWSHLWIARLWGQAARSPGVGSPCCLWLQEWLPADPPVPAQASCYPCLDILSLMQ